MGIAKTHTSPGKYKIMISDIRDREDVSIPRPALGSIINRISESMEELGLRARIEASEKSS